MDSMFRYFDDKKKKITESTKRKIFDFEDYVFETKNGMDLSGIIPQEGLVSDNKSSIAHATAYHAVWCRNLRVLFREARKTGNRLENFIDIGSGKGKACFYAHTKRSFKNIYGVEFSKPLVEVAEENKLKIGAADIQFLEADASSYMLPDASNLVFMFNPFDEFVLEKFISNNINHFKTHGSIIAYANDLHRITLMKFGFETVFRDQTRHISLFQCA